MLYCPLVQQYSCRQDCLFLRNAGCALVLAATISDDCRQKIADAEYKINSVIDNQGILDWKINQLLSK
jgi:hypothetical protein